MASGSFDLIKHKEIKQEKRLGKVLYEKLELFFKPGGKSLAEGSFMWAEKNNNKLAKKSVIPIKVNKSTFDDLCLGVLMKKFPDEASVSKNGDVEIQFEGLSKVRFKSSGKSASAMTPQEAQDGEDPRATKTYSPADKTTMRENVSMYFIGLALEEGKVFTDWFAPKGKTLTNKHVCFYPEIRRIALELMPTMETGKEAWKELYSAISGAELMVNVLKQGGWKTSGWYYDRDGFVIQPFSNPREIIRNHSKIRGTRFMDWISMLVGKYGFPKKDAWNPADIWLTRTKMTGKVKILRTVTKAVDAGMDNEGIIGALNGVMKQMFRDGEIVGVSLKKVAKPKQGAFWKIYNVKAPKFSAEARTASGVAGAVERMMTVPPTYDFTIDKMECKLKFTGNEKVGKMATQELNIVLAQREGNSVYPKGKKLFAFTVKTTAGVNKYANLKYEPTYIPRAAAKLGKAPVGDVKKILNTTYKIWSATPVVGKHCQDNTKYPKTLEQWGEDGKTADLYYNMWKSCAKEAGVSDGIITEVNNKKEFIDAFTKQFKANPKFAHTKLMQINFGSAMFTKSKPIREKIMNQMLMQAEKLGSKYGPFGKIY